MTNKKEVATQAIVSVMMNADGSQRSTEEMRQAFASMTSQQIAELTALTLEAQGKGKKTKKDTSTAKVSEVVEVVAIELLPANDTITECSLADLVAMTDTSIVGASYAMRDINVSNLANITAAIDADVQLPALTVVNTNVGQVVIDGYHRWSAYEKDNMHTLTIASGIDENGEHIPVDPYAIDNARHNYKVTIHQVTVVDERDMLDKAFKSNLAHGLAASQNSRSRYALWLLQDARIRGIKMSVREAARQALVSHVAVLKTAKKIEKAMRMVDDPLTDDELAEAEQLQDAPETEEQKAYEASSKAMTQIVKAVKVLRGQEFSDEEFVTFCAEFNSTMYKEDIEDVVKLLRAMHKTLKHAPVEKQETLQVTPVNA